MYHFFVSLQIYISKYFSSRFCRYMISKSKAVCCLCGSKAYRSTIPAIKHGRRRRQGIGRYKRTATQPRISASAQDSHACIGVERVITGYTNQNENCVSAMVPFLQKYKKPDPRKRKLIQTFSGMETEIQKLLPSWCLSLGPYLYEWNQIN
jgi:hypothetical protein